MIPRAILDSLPEPIMLLNGRRVVTDVNRAGRELFGAHMVGRDLAMAIRHPAVLDAVDAILAGIDSRTTEVTLPLGVPRSFQVHAAGIPAGADTGGVMAVLVLSETTLARRAEAMRAEFIANASHELRSPLAALLGFIETLRGPAKNDDDAQARFLEIMHREAKRMTRLLDDLFSLSRVEVNEHVPPRDPIDLGLVLGNAVDPLVMRAAERNMTIQIDVPADLPRAIGDADQLIQVFRNLVENSTRYAHASTPIRIAARPIARIPELGGPGVVVAIEDQSDGIPPEAIPRLTERFFRVDKARSQALGGTGLGLAIVKHIVNRHRGKLVIESEPGVGSRFSVYPPPTAAGAAGATPKLP
jgi:two-component system phosphate regulon sensor histidine kinase PhoR